MFDYKLHFKKNAGRLKSAIHAITIGCALTASGLSHAGLDDAVSLDLPAQTLTQSLISLGRLGQISIVFSSKDIINKQAPALDAELTPREALNILLENSDLSIVELNSRAVAIVNAETPEKEAVKKITHEDSSNDRLEEIVIVGKKVTGSYLRLSDIQGSAPVDIFTRDDLDVSGTQSMSDLFKYVPAVSGSSTSTAVSNGGNGSATVTLRGLPEDNTLVILNGRRTTSESASGRGVDLNSIPMGAISRLEILKDGASSIYGTDAIAGVINIIMKDKFDGVEIEQFAGTTSEGDLETYKTHFLIGTAEEKGGAYISGEYFKQGAIYSRDRELSASADTRDIGGADRRTTATPTARITLGDGVYGLIDGEDGMEYTDYALTDDEYKYNHLGDTSSTSPSSRTSLYASAYYHFNEKLKFRAEATANKTEASVFFAPAPVQTAFETTEMYVDQTNIYNPYGPWYNLPDVRRRIMELGNRVQTNTSRTYRTTFTLEGIINDDTSWELYIGKHQSRSKERMTNLVNGVRLARAIGPSENCQGLATDGCVPFNLFGPVGSITEDQLNYVRSTDNSTGTADLEAFSARITTNLFQLPSGPLQTAWGLEARHEHINRASSNPEEQASNIGGGGVGEINGERKIYEAFFESQIPVFHQTLGMHSLDLELSARHSDYSDFGSNTSPKIGIRFRPTTDLLLRATYSEGFRAPNLIELHTKDYYALLNLDDPCADPTQLANLPGCRGLSASGRSQFAVTQAGNPDLKPETSKNQTLGLVWTPSFFEELYFSLDHFHIKEEDIAVGGAQAIIYENAIDPNRFSEFITRDEAGNITELYAPYINIGELNISGFDATLRYTMFSMDEGAFSISLNSTYLDEFNTRLASGYNENSIEGKFVDDAEEGHGALPHWKANAGASWTAKNWQISYTANYIGELKEIPYTANASSINTGFEREVEEWITHDVQASVNLGKHMRFAIGVDNLTNEAPPFLSSAFNDNFDARNYDIRGRFMYGRLRFRF